jgi:hypothetical protein
MEVLFLNQGMYSNACYTRGRRYSLLSSGIITVAVIHGAGTPSVNFSEQSKPLMRKTFKNPTFNLR